MTLRIALVHSFYGSEQPSGENSQVEAELRVLESAGLDVRLFAARTDDRAGDRLYRMRSAFRVATGYGASPSKALASFAPDVVHVHNLFPNFGRRWLAAVEAPVVATLHNFRFACAAATLLRSGRTCTDCPDRTRLSAIRHRCYRGSLAATVPLVLGQRRRAEDDPLFARADRILCLSARQRSLLLQAGVEPDRLRDWTNFLPSNLEPPFAAPTARRGCLYAGRLTEEKGVVDLVENWSADTPLTVVGDGPLRREVERAAIGRNVAVLGPLGRREVVNLMRSSVALALPSVWPEVAPLTVIEALACGLPIILREESDLAPMLLEDGVGIAVSYASQYASAVDGITSRPGFGERCRREYERRYTEDEWRRKVLDLYRQLAS
jgi:glycosyltransferase involved in cell wall biosynthesis